MSPHIAVFTTFFEDHLKYYPSMQIYFDDKATIFKYQTEKDFSVLGTQMSLLVKQYGHALPRSYTVVGEEDIPEDWELSIIGDHNRYNMALVKAVFEYLDMDESLVQKHIEAFTGSIFQWV
jgi:UDP-N-acetylmuramoylalanine--D-glutamate ligase